MTAPSSCAGERSPSLRYMSRCCLRASMRAGALQGDRNAALAQYEAYLEQLHAVLALEPLPETQALRAQILANRLSSAGLPRQSAPLS